MPTPPEVVQRMLELAGVKSGDVLYDLGCGDGRIVIAAVKRPGVRGVCVDIDPERIADSKRNAEAAGVTDRIRFVEGDLFKVPFTDATVMTLYLMPDVNMRLRPRLLNELKPGTRDRLPRLRHGRLDARGARGGGPAAAELRALPLDDPGEEGVALTRRHSLRSATSGSTRVARRAGR